MALFTGDSTCGLDLHGPALLCPVHKGEQVDTAQAALLFQLVSCDIPGGDADTVNTAPTVSAIPDQIAYSGTTFYINLASYVQDDNQPAFALTFQISNGPGAMDGPVYSNLFSVAEIVSVEFTVADENGQSVTGSFSIDVQNGAGEPLIFPADFVFVSADGADTVMRGGIDEPYGSIGFALLQAEFNGKAAVVVACGIYIESVVIADGIHLFGGYDPGFTAHDTTSLKAIIRADDTGHYTMLAHDISTPTTVEGFLLEGPDASVSGQSSSAIHIVDCTAALEISDTIVFAGRGGAGARGVDGVDGADGADGESGYDSYETNTRIYATCTGLGTTPVPGGNGGSHSYEFTNISGGNGADSVCPNLNDQQLTGSTGEGTASGTGGAGGHNLYDDPPDMCHLFHTGGFVSTGSDGGEGSGGSSGAGGTGGSAVGWNIIADMMVSDAGDTGSDGQAGSGGGAGGHSVGIFVSLAGGSDPDYAAANTVPAGYGTAGYGGYGGRSMASNGSDGEDGTVDEFMTSP